MIERKTTKDLILSSLYDLLQEKPYEKITVSAIVKNCGISQRTFYNHFKDKHELMEWSLHQPLTRRCMNLIQDVYGDSVTDELESAVSFYVGGLISYVERALSEPETPVPEKSIRLFETCTPVCMEKYLGEAYS